MSTRTDDMRRLMARAVAPATRTIISESQIRSMVVDDIATLVLESDRDEAGVRPLRSYQDFLFGCLQDASSGYGPYKGKSPRDIAALQLENRNRTVAEIHATEAGRYARVFGSAARCADGGAVPGDFDLFVESATVPPALRKQVKDELLDLMRASPHVVDAFFLRTDGVLLCHSTVYNRASISWVVAKDAHMLISAGRAGIPVAGYHPKFALPAGLIDPPMAFMNLEGQEKSVSRVQGVIRTHPVTLAISDFGSRRFAVSQDPKTGIYTAIERLA